MEPTHHPGHITLTSSHDEYSPPPPPPPPHHQTNVPRPRIMYSERTYITDFTKQICILVALIKYLNLTLLFHIGIVVCFVAVTGCCCLFAGQILVSTSAYLWHIAGLTRSFVGKRLEERWYLLLISHDRSPNLPKYFTFADRKPQNSDHRLHSLTRGVSHSF